MDDKNGHSLQVGDEVKVFTYSHGVVIGFEYRNGVEVAIVDDTHGRLVVYSDEIRWHTKEKRQSTPYRGELRQRRRAAGG